MNVSLLFDESFNWDMIPKVIKTAEQDPNESEAPSTSGTIPTELNRLRKWWGLEGQQDSVEPAKQNIDGHYRGI